MSTTVGKSLILNTIKSYYKFKNDAEFAKHLGIAPTTLSGWHSRNTMDHDLIYSKFENLSGDFLLSGKGEVELTSKTEPVQQPTTEFLLKTDTRLNVQRIPLYEFHAAAGLVELFGEHKNIIDYLVIPNLPKSDGAIYITGDSMYPLLKSGDMVIYKQIHDMYDGIRFGEMHILSLYIDGDLTTLVKYVQKSEKGDDYIKLVSQNSYHADRHVHLKKVNAIALVKASIRLNTMM